MSYPTVGGGGGGSGGGGRGATATPTRRKEVDEEGEEGQLFGEEGQLLHVVTVERQEVHR